MRRLFRVKTDRPRVQSLRTPEPMIELNISHWDEQLYTHIIHQTLRVPLSQAKEIYADLGAEITKAEARQ